MEAAAFSVRKEVEVPAGKCADVTGPDRKCAHSERGELRLQTDGRKRRKGALQCPELILEEQIDGVPVDGVYAALSIRGPETSRAVTGCGDLDDHEKTS